MRILHVIDTLSPASGGPPEAIRQLVTAYEQELHGAKIEVVCLDQPDAPFLTGIPCPVHALGQRRLGRFAFSPRLWRWLHAHAGRFDVIIMNGIWSFPGIALRSAARREGTPYGVFVHGALDPWFNRTYPLKRLKKSLYWQGKGIDEVGIDCTSGETVVKIDSRYFRPTEVDVLLGDPSKAHRVLGWKHSVSFTDLVDEMVNSDLQVLTREFHLNERHHE